MFKQINVNDVVKQVQDDTFDFVRTELQIYLASEQSASQNLSDSVVANIAMFDMTSINSEKGYMQLNNLLGDHYDQMVERRMRQFVHKLYIQYGEDEIDSVKLRVLKTIKKAYPELRKENVSAMNRNRDTFWLVPFIKDAYNEAVLSIKQK